MSTFGEMNRRIADELNRTDVSSQINLAIKTAIKHYNSEAVSFREHRAYVPTVADKEYYPVPDDFVELDDLRIQISNNTYVLNRRSQRYLNDIYTTGTVDSGPPESFALYQEQIRVYPVPDQSYTLFLDYKRELDELSATSDTNAYMTKYEGLIRARSKWDVCKNVLKDKEQAADHKAEELDEKESMEKQEARYNISSGIRGYM